MNIIREIMRPSPSYIRLEARQKIEEGLVSIYGITDTEVDASFIGTPSSQVSEQLRSTQPELAALIEANQDTAPGINKLEQVREAEILGLELGTACVLHYFNQANERHQLPRNEPRLMPRIESRSVVGMLYDGKDLPIGRPRNLGEVKEYVDRWNLYGTQYGLVSNITLSLGYGIAPTFEILGERFNVGAFCFAAMFSGLAVIEQAGYSERLAQMPRRTYKA